MSVSFPEAERRGATGPSAATALVVGVGNMERGDDAAGRLVAQMLQGRRLPRVRVAETPARLMSTTIPAAGAGVSEVTVRVTVPAPSPTAVVGVRVTAAKLDGAATSAASSSRGEVTRISCSGR